MSLEIRRKDEICELRLDAPPGNIVDRALCQSLTGAVREHAADAHLKAFLITAGGKHFSYGASVDEHVKGEVETFLPAFHELFYALIDTAVPTVAAVQGLCLGGAFEIASFCQFVVAERSASFAVPEITLGVFPPAACAILPWVVGGARATDLILSGRRMSAEEGERCGFVTRLCDAGELEGATEKLLDDCIRPRSAAVLRHAVRAARGPFHAEIRRRLPELERDYIEGLMATRDANEGIQAFLEKRAPDWVDG